MNRSRLALFLLATLALGLVPAIHAQESDTPQLPDPTDENPIFRRLALAKPQQGWFKTFVEHEKAIWSSPRKLTRKDALWLAPLAASTALLISTDARSAGSLPNTSMQIDTGQALSRIGAPYTLFGVAGGAYIVGRFTRNERLRETGRIGTEALVHSFLITHAIKAITGRRRPEDGNGRGSFFQGRVSFPSGHGMMTWSLASVIAHEYRDHKWIVVGAYASALAVNAGRTMARKHFLSDSLVGSTVGYLLGQYLYKRNRQIANGSATSRIRIPEIIPSYDRSSKQAALSLVWRP
jgi:membrane-associated phospholipid phosphatase